MQWHGHGHVYGLDVGMGTGFPIPAKELCQNKKSAQNMGNSIFYIVRVFLCASHQRHYAVGQSPEQNAIKPLELTMCS